ncbi:hypothetical protein A4S05_06530 [Nostoc sp. KVJ20]|uniref:AbiU2 domain-containing protein n=1 Tax=Nostoc sp. KVJ20 TaxID=457944 RepID=UPI00083D52CB|nr:hypothetical protein [Nostoc sp. KVJ20]ODG98988.1 hypothetical protein A4S05_06530 [Nostoc sp. KVJ20]
MNCSRADFESKVIALGNILEQSSSHLKLSKWIRYTYTNKSLEDYPSFYHLSYIANYEIGLLKLSTVYDEDEDCLSLLKCLKIFDSHYKKWGLTNVDRSILEQDKNDISSKNNPLINRLKHLRDKTLAHTDNKLYPSPLIKDLNYVCENLTEGGDKLIWVEDRITTKRIEELPTLEKEIRLKQISMKINEAWDKDDSKLLGKDILKLNEIDHLIEKAVNICNRYRKILSIYPIELKL